MADITEREVQEAEELLAVMKLTMAGWFKKKRPTKREFENAKRQVHQLRRQYREQEILAGRRSVETAPAGDAMRSE